MEGNRTISAEARKSWPTLAGKPRMPRRHFVGIANRSALARLAGAVSEPFNLLETTQAMERAGYLVEDMARLDPRTERRAATGFRGSLYRWQLCSGQKGGCGVGKTKRGKGTKLMVLADGKGIPMGVTLHSASPAEVTLAEETLDAGRTITRRSPKRLIADRAYDSDPLRRRLSKRRIEQITPHRRNRVKASLQDGRALRRYRHRWKVERTISWLGSFRRVHTRWDRSLLMYTGFVHLACILIVCRYL